MFAISYAHKSIRPYRVGVSEAGMSTSFTVSDDLGNKIIRGMIPIEDAIGVYLSGKSPEVLLTSPDILNRAPLKAAPEYVPPKPAEAAGDKPDAPPVLTRSEVFRLTKAAAAELAAKLGVGGENVDHKDNVAALAALCAPVKAPEGGDQSAPDGK